VITILSGNSTEAAWRDGTESQGTRHGTAEVAGAYHLAGSSVSMVAVPGDSRSAGRHWPSKASGLRRPETTRNNRTDEGDQVMDLGPSELLIILAVVLVLFGGAKLPQLARSLGEAKKEFEKGARASNESQAPDARAESDTPGSDPSPSS
jgi:sec-independent protein translocase protein TatA